MGYIEKGIEEGAEVLCGGSNPFDQGYFVSLLYSLTLMMK